jgi:hypothetical protein
MLLGEATESVAVGAVEPGSEALAGKLEVLSAVMDAPGGPALTDPAVDGPPSNSLSVSHADAPRNTRVERAKRAFTAVKCPRPVASIEDERAFQLLFQTQGNLASWPARPLPAQLDSGVEPSGPRRP